LKVAIFTGRPTRERAGRARGGRRFPGPAPPPRRNPGRNQLFLSRWSNFPSIGVTFCFVGEDQASESPWGRQRMEEAGKNIATVAARSTEYVLLAEHRLIWPGGRQPKNVADYYESVQKKEQAALCLSGGGIRSAAFALGVLQALSGKGLLTGFHYLSTVSGGGYIGSWLQRWICEESRRKADDPKVPHRPSAAGAARVMANLGARREQPQVKRLRENSNFITPRVGLASHDTWTAIAISVRNILVNWLLFLPLLMAVALVPNLFLSGVRSILHHTGHDERLLQMLLGAAALAIAVAAMSTVRLLPSYRSAVDLKARHADRYLSAWIVAPLAAWAVLGTLALSVDLLVNQPTGKSIKIPGLHEFSWIDGLDLAIWSFGGMIAGLIAGGLLLKGRHRRTFLGDLLVWPSSIAVVSLWVALGASLFNRFGHNTDPQGVSGLVLTATGPLWLMCATLLGAAVFAAFRTSKGPTVKPDADREWLARLSAIKIRPMLLWAVLAVSVLLLNVLAGPYLDGGELTLSSLITVLTGAGAVAGGRSAQTGSQVGKLKSFLTKYLPVGALVSIATFLFIAALFFFLGRAEANLVELIGGPLKQGLDGVIDDRFLNREVATHLALLALLCLLIWFFSRHVPVNRFSLNGLYRNRLSRAFLGAARLRRDPDPFTGFDSGDNVRMHLLKPERGPAVLYPVVNVALNVTATENLAWQERKAEPFIISPLFSGSGMLDAERSPAGTHAGAYIESDAYGGSEPDLALGDTTGITLATAVSISGAAASPNMGYHSSPATAFLMTLFNVRLGAWLPNPARAATLKSSGMNQSSPSNSLRALLRELRGSTDDRGLDIYLSDGGHFENLALYEMIRRRCRFILVSDAGADPECAFSDLGGAIRKVKIDFDVDIDFPPMQISSRKKPLDKGQLAWALGTINYPEPGLQGQILYLKPSFFGHDLPVDVVSYAAESETFPHESTGDQFFSESQFESYRRLGEHFTGMLAANAKGPQTLKQFFAGL
jgi:hypothetical protein